LQYVDPYLKELRKTLVDSIADNATKAFDTVAEALGGVIAKTKTWKDVWISMKTAAGQFFAGIFKDLASYIIKAQIAKAMSAIMPGLGWSRWSIRRNRRSGSRRVGGRGLNRHVVRLGVYPRGRGCRGTRGRRRRQ
jgi:hypothetical protein